MQVELSEKAKAVIEEYRQSMKQWGVPGELSVTSVANGIIERYAIPNLSHRIKKEQVKK